MSKPRFRTAFPFSLALSLFLLPLCHSADARTASPGPQPPCPGGAPPQPAFAAEETPPAVGSWRDIYIAADPDCFGRLAGPMDRVVALAARFRHDGSIDDLAARIGAISETEGLAYWSTSDQAWRELIDYAAALAGPALESKRADFTAEEVRSGRSLHFLQNDTRSSGDNVYRLSAFSTSPDHLKVEVVNKSAISFTFVTLFDEGDLHSLHYIMHLGGDLWGYYQLSAVREGSGPVREASFINRAAAFYRFLRGQPGDSEPPLAR